MNRPNQAIWLIAAMSAGACLLAASLGPSRTARPVVRLLDPPVKVAGPTARDLRLQAMHELMTPVKTVLPVVTVPVAKPDPETIEVAAVDIVTEPIAAPEQVDLSYESSCGLDHATGKVYTLPKEEPAEEPTSAEPTAAESTSEPTEQSEESLNEEPRQSQAKRPDWSATVRQGARPTFVIYRRPSLVLKTENQVREEQRSAERMRTLVRSTVDQISLGSWQAVANVWVDRLNLPWEQLTAVEASKEPTAVVEAPPERESRAYRSVLRNRTLQ